MPHVFVSCNLWQGLSLSQGMFFGLQSLSCLLVIWGTQRIETFVYWRYIHRVSHCLGSNFPAPKCLRSIHGDVNYLALFLHFDELRNYLNKLIHMTLARKSCHLAVDSRLLRISDEKAGDWDYSTTSKEQDRVNISQVPLGASNHAGTTNWLYTSALSLQRRECSRCIGRLGCRSEYKRYYQHVAAIAVSLAALLTNEQVPFSGRVRTNRRERLTCHLLEIFKQGAKFCGQATSLACPHGATPVSLHVREGRLWIPTVTTHDPVCNVCSPEAHAYMQKNLTCSARGTLHL